MAGLDKFMPDKKTAPKRGTQEKEAPANQVPPRSDQLQQMQKKKNGRSEEADSEPAEAGAELELEADAEENDDELSEAAMQPEKEPEQEEFIGRTIYSAETPRNTGQCVLLSVTYDGPKGKALVKLYDAERKKIVFWYDNTGHQPYLLTDTPLQEVLSDRNIKNHPGFDSKATREVEKCDLLHDKKVGLTMVAATDPLSVGGKTDSLREHFENAWEARIRYHDCFIYDRQLIPGYTYRIRNGNLARDDFKVPVESIKEKFQKAPPEFLKSLEEWFPIFISPVPDYRRVAIDIEVQTEAQDRIPDPKVAKNPVICVSLAGSDNLRKVLVLKREGVGIGTKPPELTDDIKVDFYDDEKALLKELFRLFIDYPIVLTFNGDNFDMHYLYNRALNLGIPKEEVPILMGKEIALLPVGVHVDLYKFFHNHAIQIYAFGNSYREVTLDAISNAFLDIHKIHLEKSFSELSYLELASYCFRDSLVTLRLTSENQNVAMHLITLIMRISRLSMEDVTRQGVSSWIRNLFFFEHRAKGMLIPRREDIDSMKGEASTTAIIKGKKYQGAIVIKPQSGVFFNVVVLDFASLYPSIISKWNLSYETVRCTHMECRTHIVPNTSHWVCTKRIGMMSLIIGLLRDVRVKWFKIKSKDPSLTQEERNWYKVVQQALKVFLNACFTGDTDILTANGVKNIKEVKIGDKVININPRTLEPEVDEVVETQIFDYDGNMLHFEDGKRTDLIVTPDHKMLITEKKTGSTKFMTAEEAFKVKDIVIPKILYSNTNEALINQEPAVLAKLEFSSTRSYDEKTKSFKLIWSNEEQHTGNWIKTKIPYSGKVYCLTTKKNHTVFAGRNGKLIPCGQCYGVFGAEIFPLYCLPLADSTTAIGRYIITETIAKAGTIGINVLYGDSVSNDSKVYAKDKNCNPVETEIQNLFKEVEETTPDGKEYYFPDQLSTLSVNKEGKSEWCKVNYIMRHKVHKKMYRIWVSNAWYLDVTEDHSLIGYDKKFEQSDADINSRLFNIKPKEIKTKGNSLIVVRKTPFLHCDLSNLYESVSVKRIEGTGFATVPAVKVEEIPYSDYVYDLGVEDTHRFFANGILVHNTDSLFLLTPTKEQISSLLGWADAELGIDLEVDKRYTYVAFSGRKKNYLGVMDNGTVDIKGLMGKKRNTPPFIKDAFVEMTQVLRDVKTPQDFVNAKMMIKEIVQNCYNDLKSRKVPLEGLIFKVMLARPITHYTKTTPQHVKAAKQLADKGKEVKPGDLISFVKVQGSVGVKPVQLARIDEVDVDKYVGHIESTFGQVLEALNIEFDEIVGIKKLDFFAR